MYPTLIILCKLQYYEHVQRIISIGHISPLLLSQNCPENEFFLLFLIKYVLYENGENTDNLESSLQLLFIKNLLNCTNGVLSQVAHVEL